MTLNLLTLLLVILSHINMPSRKFYPLAIDLFLRAERGIKNIQALICKENYVLWLRERALKADGNR